MPAWTDWALTADYKRRGHASRSRLDLADWVALSLRPSDASVDVTEARFCKPVILRGQRNMAGAWVRCSSCYTDPLAAFNSNDRRKHVGGSSRHRVPDEFQTPTFPNELGVPDTHFS